MRHCFAGKLVERLNGEHLLWYSPHVQEVSQNGDHTKSSSFSKKNHLKVYHYSSHLFHIYFILPFVASPFCFAHKILRNSAVYGATCVIIISTPSPKRRASPAAGSGGTNAGKAAWNKKQPHGRTLHQNLLGKQWLNGFPTFWDIDF